MKGVIVDTLVGADLRFSVLGPVGARSGARSIELGAPKQKALLAMLLAHPNEALSVGQIISGVWGEDAPETYRRSIHTYVSNLRTLLGTDITRVGDGYRLDVRPEQIDALDFERALSESQNLIATHPADASDRLREALAMWRGRPYADLVEVEGLHGEVMRLEELRLAAVELRIDADLASGKHQQVIAEVGALAEEHPLRERLRAQHMIALYRSGRQAEALRAYERTRDYLAEELGLEPSQDLQVLELSILRHDAELHRGTGWSTTQRLAILATEVEDLGGAWDRNPQATAEALAVLDRILGEAIETAEGRPFRRSGEGMMAAFANVSSAVRAAETAQREIAGADRGDLEQLLVGMAIDIGEAESRGGDFQGPPVTRASRLASAAQGGQVLVSGAVHAEIAASPVVGLQVKQLGDHELAGFATPEQVGQLVFDGLPSGFPDLRVVTDAARGVGTSTFSLPGYEIREKVGEGAFAVVYRAYQPSVGREVAVKVIRPRLANHPRFIHRFEAEARTIARLAHPRIVPLIDFWRDTDGAYLVLQLLSGGSLEELIRPGPIELEKALRVLQHVGEALDHAHGRGAVHGNLRPANILLDTSGNAYLSDFDITARLLDPEIVDAVSAAPEFRAPEASTTGPSPATDIFSLGRIAQQLISDSRVSGVVSRATATDPARRYPNAATFLGELDGAVGGTHMAVATPKVSRNPYKGLRAFDEADAEDFHGRGDLVDNLLAAVAANRFVTVVGPSGSGKSSVVRAGLLPALMGGGIDGSSTWFHIVITPGARPTESLAAALEALAPHPRKSAALTEEGLHATTERLLEDVDGQLLIVIDQFEEVFTAVRDPTERRAFVDLLLDAVERHDTRVRVVTTLRADLYDRPLSDERLGPHLRDGQVTMLPPTRDELVEMIVSPAHAVGLTWEPGLVGQVAQEVFDRPGGLPLLQYALTELVENRQGDVLGGEDYERIGGVAGALARRAEAAYELLEPRLQETMRDILLRLVTVDEDSRDIRRRVRLSELESLGTTKADLDRILTPFVTERLLLADHDPTTRGPTVEVAHEALLREWPRLQEWIEEKREALIVTKRLQAALHEWENADRSSDYLPTGSRLASFQGLMESTILAAEEREFLETSLERDRAVRSARRRRRRALTGVLAGVTAAALVLAGFAFTQGRKAAAEAERASASASLAEARELAASAINVLDSDPELSVLLAAQATSLAEPTFETVSALHEALYHHRLLWTVHWSGQPDNFTGALSPDGDRLVLSGPDRLEVWDVDDRSHLWELDFTPQADLAITPFFTRDGTRIVALVGWPRESSHWDDPPPGVETGVYMWDAASGAELGHFPGGECPVWDIGQFGPSIDVSLPIAVTGFAPAGDGPDLVCDRQTGTVAMVNLETGATTSIAEVHLAGHHTGLSTSADGRYVAFTEGDSPRVIDTRSGDEMPSPQVRVFSAILGSDGSHLWMRQLNGFLSLWDLESGVLTRQFGTTRADRVQLDAEGSRYVHYDFDGAVVFGDIASGEVSGRLVGNAPPAARLELGAVSTSFSSDGSRLASFAGDGSAHIWSTAPLGEAGSFPAATGFITAGSLSMEEGRGALLVYPGHSPAGISVVFDAMTGDSITEISDVAGQTTRLSPDGMRMAAQFGSEHETFGPVQVHDLETGAVTEMEGLCQWTPDTDGNPQPPCVPYPDVPFQDWVRDLAFSPDGSMLALSGSESGSVTIWDSSSGAILFNTGRLMPPTENDPQFDAPTIAFAPTEQQLVVSTGDELLVYDTSDWQIRQRVPMERMTRLSFTSDGTRLAGTTPAAEIAVIDSGTWTVTASLTGHKGHIHDLAVGPDGDVIASSDVSGTVRVWDTNTGRPIQAMAIDDQSVQNVEFLNSRHLLITPQIGPNALILTIDVDELLEIARERVTRDLTTAECQTYLHLETCPGD